MQLHDDIAASASMFEISTGKVCCRAKRALTKDEAPTSDMGQKRHSAAQCKQRSHAPGLHGKQMQCHKTRALACEFGAVWSSPF